MVENVCIRLLLYKFVILFVVPILRMTQIFPKVFLLIHHGFLSCCLEAIACFEFSHRLDQSRK